MRILFIYSSNDESSLDTMRMMSEVSELKSISIPVDASNPRINAILKASNDIKVNEVPAIINYGSPDGSILKYEGFQSVKDFIDEVKHNIAQHEKEEIESPPVKTSLSDLGLEEEPEPEAPEPTTISAPPQPMPQNMPIKAKRGSVQNKRIEDFKAAREASTISKGGDNSEPSRIIITSPPMER